jgi:hypothetical protein
LVRPVGFSGIEGAGGLRGMDRSEVSARVPAQADLPFAVTPLPSIRELLQRLEGV